MNILDKYSLKNKVALVTGSGRNLGKAIALGLAEAGADVVVTSRTLVEVEKVSEDIIKMGKRSAAFKMDVTHFEQVQDVVNEIIKKFGRIDILVNNSAIRHNKPVLELPVAEWREVIDTNLTGAFLCCKAVGPHMIKQRYGRIINIASRAGIRGRANASSYCASKGALIQLNKALALEWAPHNILVNAVAPGLIITDRTSEMPKVTFEKRTAGIPLHRAAQVAEIVPCVVYLASEACTYMTGETIIIDGGSAVQ